MKFKELIQLLEGKYFDNIPCNGVKKKLGFSCGKDKKSGKVFVYTHRARCKDYDNLENIPLKDLEFIDSTG